MRSCPCDDKERVALHISAERSMLCTRGCYGRCSGVGSSDAVERTVPPLAHHIYPHGPCAVGLKVPQYLGWRGSQSSSHSCWYRSLSQRPPAPAALPVHHLLNRTRHPHPSFRPRSPATQRRTNRRHPSRRTYFRLTLQKNGHVPQTPRRHSHQGLRPRPPARWHTPGTT